MTTFNVYRREPSDINPPVAIATGLTSMSYSDTTAEEDNTYLYSVGAVKNGVEKIGTEKKVVASDIYNKTDFLLVADNTAIGDLSKNSRPITIHGNLQYVDSSVNTPLFANGSYFFDGVGDAIDVDISTLGTSNFTFEMWVKLLTPSPSKSWHRYFDLGNSSGSHAFSVSNNSTNNPQRPQMYAYNTANTWQQFIAANKQVPFNQYKHICLMRKNGVFYLHIHGELSGYNNLNTALSIEKNKLRIGADIANPVPSASETKMYLDSFRVVKDAIYDTNGFTPPTSKFIY